MPNNSNQTNAEINSHASGFFSIFFKNKNSQKEKDFFKNEDAARKYGNKKFNKWANSLSENERESIASYARFSRKVNTYLRDFKNPLKEEDLAQNKNSEEYKKNNKIIEGLDSALLKAKTERTIYVYRRVDEWQFFSDAEIVKENTIYTHNNPTKINKKVINNIINQFIKPQKEYQAFAYTSTSLSQDPIGTISFGSSRPILLKIKIPKGSNAAFLGKKINKIYSKNTENQNEILISRNSTFKYKDAQIIKEFGFEVLSVSVDLVKN